MRYFVTYRMIFENTVIVEAADKEAAANKGRRSARLETGWAGDSEYTPDEVEIVEVKPVPEYGKKEDE